MLTVTNPSEGRIVNATRPSISLEPVCIQLAAMFDVEMHEVGVLRIEQDLLRFLHPVELRHVGAIPLGSRAVAASVARTRRAQAWNDFTQVPHWSIFETVRLQTKKQDAALLIQKFMSAPVINAHDNRVVGVIQVSRKGATRDVAGPDFTPADLQRLVLTSSSLADFMPFLEPDDAFAPRRMTFSNQLPPTVNRVQ